MMEVWVIESGEYEQRSIDGVAVSVAAAVEFLKQTYGPPYIVTWDEPVQEQIYLPNLIIFKITGHFEHVMNYSCRHDCDFEIQRYELAGG